MRVAEIVELASLLHSARDPNSLASSLGEVRRQVGDWLILVTPSEPRWSEARIEKSEGRAVGIGIELRSPEALRWDQLAARYGAAELRPPSAGDRAALGSIAFIPRAADAPFLLVHRASEDRVAGVTVRRPGT